MRILIVYGSVTGQTRKVSEYIASRLRGKAHSVELHEAGSVPLHLDPAGFDAVLVASPVRMGKYRPSVIAFAARYRDVLARLPSAFISVSMAAANMRNREVVLAQLGKWDAAFAERSGWKPARLHHVAGGLPYTKYSFVTRWIMKRIARAAGNATDTSRDHEYTDWEDLDRFTDTFVATAG